MAKGLRCAWAVFFHFHFRFIWFYLAYSLAGYFHAFSGKWVFFFFLFEGCQHLISWLDCFPFQFFFLFLTHEAAFHYRSSGSFFHWLFSIYPLVIQLLQSSVCLFFFPFFFFSFSKSGGISRYKVIQRLACFTVILTFTVYFNLRCRW